MSYWIKNGSSFVKNYSVNISADSESSYVSVCWLGVIRDDSNSCIADDIQTYCESVYIGLGQCDEKAPITGTIQWNDCVITYTITQEKAECKECEFSACTCEIISSRVTPYIIEPKPQELSGITEYWFTSVDTCGNVVREKRIDIETFQCPSEVTAYTCDVENRELSLTWDFNVGSCTNCHQQMDGTCYVAMPENCCETTPGICYEIGDVYYINSNGSLINDVAPSGETIYFYFDYKKTETDNECNTKTTYGRFDGKQQNIPWVISGCIGSECCKSSGVTSAFTWTSHTTCGGNTDMVIPLKITRRRDVNYTGDCKNVCEQDVGYCVDKTKIKKEYKASNGDWTPITDDYAFPYYGGNMRVSWEYSAFTVYDDCTTGFTSGNTWEDIVDILPYTGDCGDGSVNNDVHYVFKKSPCEVENNDKFPSNISGKCSGDCTEFTVTYKQNKKSCDDECGTCINPLDINITSTGATTTSSTISQGCTVTVVSNPEWITATTSDTQVTFTLTANSGSTREGGVTFKLNNKECYDTVIITQSGSSQDSSGDTPDTGDTPVVCDCDSTFEVRSISKIPSGGGNVRIGSYIFDECIDKNTKIQVGGGTAYTITSTSSSFSIECEGSASFGIGTEEKNPLTPEFVSNITFADDGFIYADVEANSQSFERTGYLAVTYVGCKTEQIVVTQEKGKCSSYLSIDGSVCNDMGGSLTIKIENG